MTKGTVLDHTLALDVLRIEDHGHVPFFVYRQDLELTAEMAAALAAYAEHLYGFVNFRKLAHIDTPVTACSPLAQALPTGVAERAEEAQLSPRTRCLTGAQRNR
jgi:hypothetical protein